MWERRETNLTQGKAVGDRGHCNYDNESSKHCRNADVTDQGFSDEAIVTVKATAEEIMAT